MGVSVQTIVSIGASGMLIDVECVLANSLPSIIIVGCAGVAVTEAKERIRGAFTTSRIMLPRKRITVNLAPADLPKADSSFDLAIAVAIFQTSEQIRISPTKQQAFIGELGLDGSTRGVRGIIGKILFGRGKGITTFFIPKANLAQACLVPNISLVPIERLQQLHEHLTGVNPIEPIITSPEVNTLNTSSPPLSNSSITAVIGQEQAKRALEIAAAGGHNLLLSGPPGTGKSMLAKALRHILPPLTREEMLEVTQLHSLASHDYEQIVMERPFRAPHHSASHVAITGGGSNPRPGEISLAHRGVLFFDELPEFGRKTLEALRQPLEDSVISIARAKDMVEYPANFIMIATANPCPCGYYGSIAENCHCQPYEIKNYQQKISGPILDRIDLRCHVSEVKHQELLNQNSQKPDTVLRQRIAQARDLQAKRYRSPTTLNADMTNVDIKKLAKLAPDAITLLNTAAERLHLSARSYMRIIKVARTIADLGAKPTITSVHIGEALAYRG